MGVPEHIKQDVIHFLSARDRREVIEVATHLFANKMQTSMSDAITEALALCGRVRKHPELLSFYQKKGCHDWFLAFYQSNDLLADGLLVRYVARNNQIKKGCILAVSVFQDVKKLRQEVGECLSGLLATSGNVIPLHISRARMR